MEDIQYGYVGDIVKFDETPDGLMVYGTAASPALDLDAQICDPAWLAKAMPDWYQFGNVREQHGKIAAGIGKSLDHEDGDKWQLKSLIVDDNTIKKVRAGVLKGYSVGIKQARLTHDKGAPGGRIVDGKIVEVSLVDRPCNPEATMSLAKAEGANLAPVDQAGVVIHKADDVEDTAPAEVEVAKTESTGCGCCANCSCSGHDAAADGTLPGLNLAADPDAMTMPDGSYPIKDQHSLDSAAGLAGKSKTYSKKQVQAHVRAAASKLGLQLPASYSKTVEADTITGETAEVAKSATVDPLLTPDLVKTITAQAVAEALAEANRLSEDRIKAVEAELAKVLATPAPGGPVIIAPPRDISKQLTPNQRERARLERRAELTDDPTLRRGFQELAAKLKD